jgi:hypothetical protein
MATGLKSRIAYKTPTASATSGDYWAGTYKLLLRAKSIPSPFGSQNMVDTSTLEIFKITSTTKLPNNHC